MLFYPQLLTGSVAQFPIARNETHRTVISAMPDGTVIRSTDPGAGKVEWALSYSHLTNAEWAAIQTLFEAAQGQLNTFAFLDPTDNLLPWSLDLTNAAWTKDPLLTVTPGVTDPLGGTAAFQLTNTGQAPQGLTQALPAPAGLTYCLSVFLRSAVPAAVTLTATDGTQEATAVVSVGTAWSRATLVSRLASTASSIRLGISLPPGAQADAYGMQAEAQPAPSLYKSTTDRGGVYPQTRFASDALQLASAGVNSNAGTVHLFSAVQD